MKAPKYIWDRKVSGLFLRNEQQVIPWELHFLAWINLRIMHVASPVQIHALFLGNKLQTFDNSTPFLCEYNFQLCCFGNSLFSALTYLNFECEAWAEIN